MAWQQEANVALTLNTSYLPSKFPPQKCQCEMELRTPLRVWAQLAKRFWSCEIAWVMANQCGAGLAHFGSVEDCSWTSWKGAKLLALSSSH